MRLVKIEDTYFLEHEEQRVKLDERDLSRLKAMTPLGRKVHFLNKAKEMLKFVPGDIDAGRLIEWFQLSASEWAMEGFENAQ